MSSSRSAAAPDRPGWLAWAAGALAAIGSYLLLHHLAENDANPQIALAQYVVPAALFAVAALAAIIRRRRPGGSGGSLVDLSIDDIRALLRETFQAQGYQPAVTSGKDARGDLVLRRGHETFLVWTKAWRERRVGVEVVEQLCRAMNASGAGGGFVVTTGRFGRDATTFAAGHNVRLIDGAALRDLRVRPASARGR